MENACCRGCRAELVPCEHGCGQVVLRRILAAHVKRDCPHRLIPCRLMCGAEVCASAFAHASLCVYLFVSPRSSFSHFYTRFAVSLRLCRMRAMDGRDCVSHQVHFSEVMDHEATMCVEAEIPCPEGCGTVPSCYYPCPCPFLRPCLCLCHSASSMNPTSFRPVAGSKCRRREMSRHVELTCPVASLVTCRFGCRVCVIDRQQHDLDHLKKPGQ